ncbi:hypothetical protein BH23GEM9_BH23GEM9_23860 [soil metagenome]
MQRQASGVDANSRNGTHRMPHHVVTRASMSGLRLCLWICLLVMGTAPLTAQSVIGRVLDAESGAGIPDVRVALLRADGTRVGESVTNRDGAFHIGTWITGEHRLEASHIAYRATSTAVFNLGAREELVVDIRMSSGAITLDPLTITARRRDLRGDPTVEGFYSRQLLTPQIGNTRVITRLDPELAYARDARDVLTWLPRPQRRPFGRGGDPCMVMYWNGHMVIDSTMANMWLETPPDMLEGLEYYQDMTEAPISFRQIPPYLYDCSRLSVLALWARTGYYGDLPADLRPSSRRVNVATGLYHVAGKSAPGVGAGIEVAAHWPAIRDIAVGVNVRRTAHHLSAETTADAVIPVVAPLYRTPPGRRPLTLWVGGLEGRLMLPEAAGIWPFVSVRLQAAHRSFTLESLSFDAPDATITSTGYGGGLTVGGEILIRGRFAAHAALGHDRLFFGPYSEIDHRSNPTSAHWGGTSLRLGLGYALQRR